MQSLTNSGWISSRTTESLFMEIISNLQEGGGRIDPHSGYHDYTFSEAQSAFNRVARQHGWR